MSTNKKQTTANKSSHQKCFFAAQGLILQNGQNHGLQLFCANCSHVPALQQKLAMPLQPHCPPSFCPLSPEAYLLTGEENL